VRVSALEGHRLWAPVYDSGINPLLALESRIVRGMLPCAPVRVIDVACGTGRWASYFNQFGTSVYGVDSCEEMLAQAAKHRPLKGRLALADAEHLPFREGIADLVLCSFAASYFRDLQRALIEMARVSAPGACVVISDMHPAAMAAGWSRSFRAGASLYEIETAPYSIAEMQAATVSAGLRLTAHLDASFGELERPLFECAGKQDLFARLSAIPAIWIGLWRKP
jgi:SAM-dependent methyltransferase